MVSTLSQILTGALVSSHSNYKDDLSVVFVSCDHSEGEMKQFIAGKGFLHVPYNLASRNARWTPLRREIQEAAGVSMLPTLVILDGASGKILTSWGRAAVTRNFDNCVKEWKEGSSGCSWMTLVTGGGCNVM